MAYKLLADYFVDGNVPRQSAMPLGDWHHLSYFPCVRSNVIFKMISDSKYTHHIAFRLKHDLIMPQRGRILIIVMGISSNIGFAMLAS